MTTPFDLLRATCGLSQREAADMLGVRLDTVKNWSIGRRNPPEAVLADLAALAMRVDQEAKAVKGSADVGAAGTDQEAQSMGWPCVGAQHAFAGRVIARRINQSRSLS